DVVPSHPLYAHTLHDALPISCPGQIRHRCSLAPRSSGVSDEFAAASNRVRTTAVAGSAPAAAGAEHAPARRPATGLGHVLPRLLDRKSTRLHYSHVSISHAVF